MSAMDTINIAVSMEPQIKMAMKKIGLSERTEEFLDVLDEIELDMALEESMKQADRGETITLDELERRMKEKFASGYFDKESVQKRRKDRATMTINRAAIEPRIKMAMENIGLGERTDELLDILTKK
jgi:hypothetical protein